MRRWSKPPFLAGNLVVPQALQTSLPDGLAGNLSTLDVMKRVARNRAALPIVRSFAIHILNTEDIGSQDYEGEALAIGKYVQQQVRYVKDPTDIEQLTDPLTLLEQIGRDVARGDCDDMALLIASMLLAIGHTPVFRCARYEADSGGYNHIYVVDYVESPGGEIRIPLDAIIKNKPMGYEVPQVSGDEYEV